MDKQQRAMTAPWRCPWCHEIVDLQDAVEVGGLEEWDGLYCSSDCLFHILLADRVDNETFDKVQTLINLGDTEKPTCRHE